MKPATNPRPRPKTGGETPPALHGTARLRVWLRLLACSTLIETRLRRNLAAEFGLTLPVFDILVQIDRPPLGPSMGELSKRLMVSKGSVTDLVERLERKGLVFRRSDPDDGRLQHVFLSPRAKNLLDRVIPVHDSWIRQAMQGLDADTLADLERGLGRLKDSLRRDADMPTPRTAGRSAAKAPRTVTRTRGDRP